jgi:AcrR family transcriptional regulator
MSGTVITYTRCMARWEGGAAERLQQAAIELFAEQGFEQTTATEIAQRVGLTERTFYRHFSDKREVLFHGRDTYLANFLTGLAAAPADATPMAAVTAAVRGGAAMFTDERRPWSRTRQQVIDANPALLERERHKQAHLASVLADALRERGADPLTATLAGESGATVFGIAFGEWIRDGETRPMIDVVDDVLGRLRDLTAR